MKCETYRLGDVCTFIDYRGKTPPKTTSGIPLITAKIVKNGVIQEPQEFIAEDYYDEWMRRGIPRKGSVIFTTEAPLGEVARIRTDDKLAFAQRIIILEPNEQYIYADYLFYALQDYVLKGRIEARATGTTVIGIKAAELKKVEIDLPSLEMQKKIASILCSLDDKIELNNKINENLQQQAFTLFEKFLLDAEDGECQVSDIAYLNPKRSLAKNQTARCIDMSQLSTTGAFPLGWEMKAFTGGMRFANGDTLLARITPCLENGKAAYISFLDEDEIAFGSTEYIVLAPKPGIPPEYLYCLARYPAFVDYAVKNMNGSSGRQRVTADTIGQYSLPKLSDEQYRVFDKVCAPLFRKMEINWQENRRLAQLRDALLPKLMNGEIELDGI